MAGEFQDRERVFKRIGATLGVAFKHIDRGMDIVDRIAEARDENERELYCSMVTHSVHHSWQTVTKLMRQIAKELDHDMPKGKGASLALVHRMSQRTNDRPMIVPLKHIDTIQKIGELHREFRQAKLKTRSPAELIDFMEMISDEIVPEMMENIRVLALASPDGANLIALLRPNGENSIVEPGGRQRRAG